MVKSPVGQALGGILKGAARQALPMVGSALGGYFGGPAGAKIGGQLASGAGQIFGLETEGLSHEDEAYEVAKHRPLSGRSGEKRRDRAGWRPQSSSSSGSHPAAQRHAPGLLSATAPPAQAGGGAPVRGFGRGRTGRWVRRGNRIILYGV